MVIRRILTRHRGAVAVAALLSASVVFHPALQGKVLGAHVVSPPLKRLHERPLLPTLFDVEVAVLPFLRHGREALRAGRIPLWNPDAGCGAPFLANQQCAALHPFTWIAALFPWRSSLLVLALLRFLLAFSGTALLAGDLGLGPAGRIVAAAAWATSGVLVSYVAYPVAGAIAHAPLLLFLSRRDAGRGAWLALAAAFASSVVAGHMEYLPLCWGLALACALGLGGAGRWRRAGRCLSAMVLGAALSAALLLPAVEYLEQSPHFQRRSRHDRHIDRVARAWPGLVDLSMLARSRTLAGAPGPEALASFHFGSAGLALAFVGARRRPRLALLGLAASALLFLDSPVARLVWSTPPLRMMSPERAVFLTALALALLAGAGLDAILAGRRDRLGIAAAICASVLLVALEPLLLGARYGPLPGSRWLAPAGALVLLATSWRAPRAAAAVACAALLLERLLALGSLNLWTEPARLFPDSPVLARIARSIGPDRFAASGPFLYPNMAGVYGIRDARHYDAIELAGLHELLAPGERIASGLWPRVPSPASRKCGATVVAYRTVLATPGVSELRPDGSTHRLEAGREVAQPLRVEHGFLTEVAIWQEPAPGPATSVSLELRETRPHAGALRIARLPRRELAAGQWVTVAVDPPLLAAAGEALELVVRVAPAGPAATLGASAPHAWPAARGGGAALDHSLAHRLVYAPHPDLDPIVSADGFEIARDLRALPRARLASAPEDRTSVTYLEDEAGSVVLAVDAPAADTLILADSCYPGWTAAVDGAAVAHRCEGGFRAVELTAGRHEVAYRYRPASYRIGLFVSLLALAFAAGAAQPGLTARALRRWRSRTPAAIPAVP